MSPQPPAPQHTHTHRRLFPHFIGLLYQEQTEAGTIDQRSTNRVALLNITAIAGPGSGKKMLQGKRGAEKGIKDTEKAEHFERASKEEIKLLRLDI